MTVLLAPMRAEARALRRGAVSVPPGTPVHNRDAAPAHGRDAAPAPPGRGAVPVPTGTSVPVLHTGTGPVRAARAAARLPGRGGCVAGVGGGLVDRLRTGDVVVADEVRGPDGAPVRLDRAAELAALLRAAGLTVHIGQIASRPRIVAGSERDRLAATGALLADTESYWLLSGPVRPVCCVRVVADCVPGPVFGPATLWHLRTALRRLRTLAGPLAGWAATAGTATPGDPAVPAAPGGRTQVAENQSHQPLKEVR